MDNEIRALEEQIEKLKEKLSEARRSRKPEPIGSYQFETADGQASLSDLFGSQSDLLVIHNMGASCPYCTLWADGLNSLLPHIESRTAFVVVSPDAPDAQARFAESRSWNFRMASDTGRDFTSAMGYWTEKDGSWPGVSAFRRNDDGSIIRTGTAFFGPGDDFCAVWPLFDLLANGANEWEPRYRYDVK
jgi:predicted dithiol-disulfide oxidoreductase (DUF899 family)